VGAGEAHCFDIDPQALTATRRMPRKRRASTCLHIRSRRCTTQSVDVLVANILSGPLCELAPTFGTLVRGGGSIVLAGLLNTRLPT